MPFPLIPFLLGAIVGSLVTYVMMREPATIEIRPGNSDAQAEPGDHADKESGDDSEPAKGKG